jgi:hypothetical protein
VRNYLPDAPKQPFGYPGRYHLILGGNVDSRHHCYLCRLGSSIDYFGASRPLASKQSRSNRTHCLPYRASGRRMRVRISAHPLAGSVGPLALGPLHFEDAQESITRKHGELARFMHERSISAKRRWYCSGFDCSDAGWANSIDAAVAGLVVCTRQQLAAPPPFPPPDAQQFEQLRRQHRVAVLAPLAALDA